MPITFQRELNDEEKTELAGLAAEAAMIAGITDGASTAAAQLAVMKDFLEENELDEVQVTDYAFKFGSLFGSLVEITHGWRWGMIRFEDGETRFAVLSPNRDHGIAVHELFFNHLSGAKESNFVSLFNLLQKTPKPRAAAQGILLFN